MILVLGLCSLVIKGTQLWIKSQWIPGSNPRQVNFYEEIADLVESLDYAAGEHPVPEWGSMQLAARARFY
jgi:hypothetical protein